MKREITIVAAADVAPVTEFNGTKTAHLLTACEHFCLPAPSDPDNFVGTIGDLEKGDIYQIEVIEVK